MKSGSRELAATLKTAVHYPTRGGLDADKIGIEESIPCEVRDAIRVLLDSPPEILVAAINY